jgi:hypothetical protein
VIIWRSRPISRTLAVVLPLLLAGCYQPRRVLTIASPPDVVEGQRTRVTVTVQNILPHAIIPVSMTLYARRDPTEQFAPRRVIGDREFLAPLQATKVRHLTTLNRVEADHVRDGGVWRRVPDTRFLHPRVLLPGQSLAETFDFQALESHRRRLYCDLYYFRLDGDEVRGRLYVRDPSRPRPKDADSYTDVYTLVTSLRGVGVDANPADYILYRRRVPSPQATLVITKRVPLRVRPRAFSFRKAIQRARFAPRAHCYFTPAHAWVFDYPDATWCVTPSATLKLRGRYIRLLADLDRDGAQSLTLTAPRKPSDKLLELFQKSGYSDPKATDQSAKATIPAAQLLPILHQAETLGYRIDATTWRPAEKP